MTKLLLKFVLTAFIAAPMLSGCGGGSDEPEQKEPEKENKEDNKNEEETPTQPTTTTFAKGADVSWVTEMEADGKKFYNNSGAETDLFKLMKDLGMNAIRLRVWVNPEKTATSNVTDGGYGAAYCDKTDVVAKAKRAVAQGLDVMIDFHYSDVFADPSRQSTPLAWRSYTLAQLKTAVSDHTKDVLNALNSAGVTPKWIQIGNETRNGMLHSAGQLWTDAGDIANGWSNFAGLVNAGYDAAKSVFPNALVMVHLNNAYEDNAWWFTKLKAAGGKFDMIGLSHYPMTADGMTWKEANTKAIANIKTWAAAYGVKIMVCEVGVKPAQSDAATCMQEFMTAAKGLSECAGVFYWEPEVYGSWRPKTYINVWKWNAYDMGAFSDSGRPTSILDAFK